MAKVLKCGDIQPGCNFEMRGSSEEEVMKKAGEHAKTAHNIQEITPELAARVRGAIHEEGQAKGRGTSSN